jgi:hypothetical protein
MTKKMKLLYLIKSCVVCAALISSVNIGFAGNIDPDKDGSRYAYSSNVGWLNFEPNVADPNAGAMVTRYELTGYVWVPNIGWVSLSCSNTNSCGRVDYGVVNDGNGMLSGYAWSANAGWISFSCGNTGTCASVNYGVTIDGDGNFNGWAYGQNIGWIHFSSVSPVAYKVKACVVNLFDLANFADDWLIIGSGLAADLDGDDDVEFKDYSIFAGYWRDYCPAGWQLK